MGDPSVDFGLVKADKELWPLSVGVQTHFLKSCLAECFSARGITVSSKVTME